MVLIHWLPVPVPIPAERDELGLSDVTLQNEENIEGDDALQDEDPLHDDDLPDNRGGLEVHDSLAH